MPGYRTPEYLNLLAAERAIVNEIQHPTEESNLASLGQALVRVIDQKRIMRMKPAPKPVDVTLNPKSRYARARQSSPSRQLIDVTPQPLPPSDLPAKPV